MVSLPFGRLGGGRAHTLLFLVSIFFRDPALQQLSRGVVFGCHEDL